MEKKDKNRKLQEKKLRVRGKRAPRHNVQGRGEPSPKNTWCKCINQ